MTDAICSIDGCESRQHARRMCQKHYKRTRQYGDPQMTRMERDPLKRLRDRTLPDENGCWVWQGRLQPDGYARVHIRGVSTPVHRWSYEHFVGPIPAGLVIDHLCRNRACCNPAHLEAVVQRTNVMRAPTALPTINAAKTHCIRGHELAGRNLVITRNGIHPARQCRTCINLRAAEYRRRRRAELFLSTSGQSSAGSS